MYFVCIDSGEPIAHASLEAALKALRSELRAREAQGYVARFDDTLVFELQRRAGQPHPGNGATHRLWIEDQSGQKVTSGDAAEAG